MTTTRPIRFWHQGQLRSVEAASPTRTVLDWLRDDAHCTGTKEGCNEGDCGACTVSVGELDADGRLQLKPVNACLQFLPTLDGKALFTVEDLGAGGLHPVQQCLVDCHGSQCGFCTPGFVMSMWTQWEQVLEQKAEPPTRQQWADQLAGNLCRCTGYRPILDAAEQSLAHRAPRLDRAPVEAALQSLQGELSLPGFHAPRTLAALAALRLEKPAATLLAGSTDIGLWVNKQFRDLGEVIYLGRVAELQAIGEDEQGLHIGAGASLDAAWALLAARWPALQEIWLRFAAPPLRSTGTMGGNVANGSPIGDSAPVLMALDAEVELQRGPVTRRIPLSEFYTGYMQNQLQAGEFLRALHVPPNLGFTVQAHKISKRFDSDISAVCGAFALKRDGERVEEVRLAWGGLAATVKRAAQAEAALRGRVFDESALADAQAALAQDFQPLSDMRASAAYRLQTAQALLRRLWLSQTTSAPLSVWSTR